MCESLFVRPLCGTSMFSFRFINEPNFPDTQDRITPQAVKLGKKVVPSKTDTRCDICLTLRFNFYFYE